MVLRSTSFPSVFENLKITEDRTNDDQTRHRDVVSCLNRDY